MDKLIERKSRDQSGDIFIRSITVRIFISSYLHQNSYKAVITKKDGQEFVGYGGYPLEAMEAAIRSLEFRLKDREELLHDDWE